MLRNRRAEIVRERLCRQGMDEPWGDDKTRLARKFGAIWAVGQSSERAGAMARGCLRSAEQWDSKDLMFEFARGAEVGLTKAIETMKPMGYTVKDFDKWGWLPDDPEQRPARLAELGL